VPEEYRIKFENEKKMDHGAALTAPRVVQDEMRIRYLQFELQYLKDFQDRESREMEIRMRNRMHGYVRACLETIMKELKREY
jgi:hypothetical protein